MCGTYIRGLKYCLNIAYKRDVEMLCIKTEIALTNLDDLEVRKNELAQIILVKILYQK